MSFSNFEFPNTNFYNSDLRELIAMYKKLVEEYDSIKSEIDECVKRIDEFDEYVQDIVEEAVLRQLGTTLNAINLKIENLYKQLEDVYSKLDEAELNIIELTNSVINLRETLKNEINKINQELINIYSMFAQYKDSIDRIISDKIQELIEYIDEHITHIDRLYVINPLSGEYVGIQNVLDMICDYLLRGYGLTADEYDGMRLTAYQYSALRITAIEYSMRGYLLFYKFTALTMRNPFTGLIANYEVVINDLVNLHKSAYTAQEYDDMLLTAEEYDALLLTAYVYDWKWKPGSDLQSQIDELKKKLANVVEINENGSGITADEYDLLQQIQEL